MVHWVHTELEDQAMPLPTRRSVLATFAAAVAAPVVLPAGTAVGQTVALASAGDQAEYVRRTLTVGNLSLVTSEVAMEKARYPLLLEFAQLEIAEQQAIAAVLHAAEAEPPVLSEELVARAQALQAVEAGPDFDMAYVEEQIQVHAELLQIQRLLSDETEPSLEAVTARLSQPAVESHLAMLGHIRLHLLDAAEIVPSGAATVEPPAS